MFCNVFFDNFNHTFFCSIGPTLSSMFLLKQYQSIDPALLLPSTAFTSIDPVDLYD